MIRVTVQTEKRMRAITELAQAINKLATALAVTPQVHVTDCSLAEGAISVNTAPEITDTSIMRID